MLKELDAYAADKLNLNPSSRNFSIVLNRAVRILSDLKIYENKIPKNIINLCGRKQLIVAYTLMKIQKDVIRTGKTISMPSILALAIASKSTPRHVMRVIKKIIDNGSLHLANYYLLDKDTGEMASFAWKTSSKRFKACNHKKTNGKLRKIINPHKKIKEFIQATKTQRKSMIEKLTFANELVIKIIKGFWNRQDFDTEIIKNNQKTDPPDNLDDIYEFF